MNSANVLLITIDSLRADHTSCLDHDSNVDPRLKQLGDRGAVFQQAVANGPNTTASFPSILTGAHSLTYGPYGVCGDRSPFLSQELRDAGYRTIGYHSNPHLGVKQGYPTGFDLFEDLVEGDKSVATAKDRVDGILPTNSTLYRLLRRAYHYFSMTTSNEAYARADTISDNAIHWISENGDERPFFAWLHYMDVHYPFQPPTDILDEISSPNLSKRRIVNLNGKMQERPEKMTEKDLEDLQTLYDAEIRYTDRQIGRVIDALEENNILDSTFVIVTADHGEAFGEHGRFGHHPYPYEELLRVPLIIAGPSIEPTTSSQQVSLLDLAPTILDLVGLEPSEKMEGESFTPAVFDEKIDDRTAMSISDNGEVFGCRTTEWKYITRWNDDEAYLYDLSSDPVESRNLYGEYPEIVNHFESLIEEYRNGIDTASETNIDHSSEVQQRLADLGYVDE